MMGRKFSELIKIGEVLEDDLKSKKVRRLTTLQTTENASPNDSMKITKNEEEIYVVTATHPFAHALKPNIYPESSQTVRSPHMLPPQDIYHSEPHNPYYVYLPPNYQQPLTPVN